VYLCDLPPIAVQNGQTTFATQETIVEWLGLPRAGLSCGMYHRESEEDTYMLAVGGWTIDNSTGTPMRVATDYVDLFDWEYK
jgi:hypothetical protein